MPIYEYRCGGCGERFEELICRPDEAVLCPKCHSEKAEKLFSPFGIAGAVKFSASTGSSACMSCTNTNCSTCMSSSR